MKSIKKHLVLPAVFLFFLTNLTNAQAPLYTGGKQLNGGFGFSGWGLPVYAGLDFGVARNFTMGGEISFRLYDNSTIDGNWNHTIITISGNGNYHFNSLMDIPSNWDFYAGLSLGYSIWNTTYDAPGVAPDYTGAGGSGIFLRGQVGGRYFFNDRFGINLELGGGTVAGGKFGLTYIL